MSPQNSVPRTEAPEESNVRLLIENWAQAVRNEDYAGILAYHSTELLMFDVPPPFESKGLAAYRKTWDLFYTMQPRPIRFDIQHMDVVAGSDVAFVSASMQCDETDENGKRTNLDFRLTVGLRKIDGRWTILHEHHSIPAT